MHSARHMVPVIFTLRTDIHDQRRMIPLHLLEKIITRNARGTAGNWSTDEKRKADE